MPTVPSKSLVSNSLTLEERSQLSIAFPAPLLLAYRFASDHQGCLPCVEPASAACVLHRLHLPGLKQDIQRAPVWTTPSSEFRISLLSFLKDILAQRYTLDAQAFRPCSSVLGKSCGHLQCCKCS